MTSLIFVFLLVINLWIDTFIRHIVYIIIFRFVLRWCLSRPWSIRCLHFWFLIWDSLIFRKHNRFMFSNSCGLKFRRFRSMIIFQYRKLHRVRFEENRCVIRLTRLTLRMSINLLIISNRNTERLL